MPKKIGFDSEKYLNLQKAAILDRVSKFRNKLYLEFGGKLIYDYHAAGLRRLGVNLTSESNLSTKSFLEGL